MLDKIIYYIELILVKAGGMAGLVAAVMYFYNPDFVKSLGFWDVAWIGIAGFVLSEILALVIKIYRKNK